MKIIQDSLDAVEAMIKKQTELENMLKRQETRFKQLDRETKAERLERERLEEQERKIREEKEAKIREEQKRLDDIRRKQEEVMYYCINGINAIGILGYRRER